MPADVLVLGGGFAGLAAVGELARWSRRGVDLRVRLVDRREDSLFSPLLPDLITGRTSPPAVAYPLAAHCHRLGVKFTCAEVRGIDTDSGRVETDKGALKGDCLIVCLGCETDYFGNREMAARAPGLKTVEDGLAIRSAARVVARKARDGGSAAIVVVGGGYTGFEAASQLAALASATLHRPYRELPRACPIVIVEKSDEVLHNCLPDIRAWSLELIGQYGVQVRTGTGLDSYEADGTARLSDGSQLAGALVVWCAGVTPGTACARLDAPKVAGGRLAVDECLRLPGCEHVFAAGDVAGPLPPGAERPLRMSVQFSLAGGRSAARNLVRALRGKPLRKFRPVDLGYVVPLAPGKAAGEVLGRPVHGRVPNLLHYFMCTLRSWSWRNRWEVLRGLGRGERAPA